MPIVRLWFLYKLHPSWVTRLVCAYTGEKTTGLEPHPCVVYLLTLSLANYILLSPVCWIALEGHPAGLPLRLVIPCLRCLGLPGWRALKGCPAGLPLRLDSWTVSSCSCACSGPWSCSCASSFRFCSCVMRSPWRDPSPVPAPVGYTRLHHASLVSWDAGDL